MTSTDSASTPGAPGGATAPAGGGDDFERAQLEVKRKELEVRLRDIDRAMTTANTPWWRRADPMTIVILGGILTVIGNVVVSHAKATDDQRLESLKAKYNLILHAIATNNVNLARANINFFVEANLLEDQDGKIRKALDKFAPVLPSEGAAKDNSEASAKSLPTFHGDANQMSVSGFSAGAYMAVQYQVAYSASVMGAGVVAGGPYYCAAGSLVNALACMGPSATALPNPVVMLNEAKKFASMGQIDPLSNLAKARLYLFSGTNDSVVRPKVVEMTAAFFKLAGVADGNIAYENHVPAGHAMLSPSYGNACATSTMPYVNTCTVTGKSFDLAGVLLRQIYGDLKPAAATPTGRMLSFNQREFSKAEAGMADEAFLYVPKACEQGAACKIHVVFHGCKQSAALVGDAFYAKTGYNNWADSNNILVLYPQVSASSILQNPNGCWDWFGYTGPNYALKSGAQLSSVHAMLGRLTGKPAN